MSTSLLPPNASSLERALEAVAAERIEAIEVERLRALWTPADCPAPLLPWLAWALSVDEWDGAWPEATQRAVIAASIDVHRHKGTVAAVRRALAAAGYGDAVVLEGASGTRYDGTCLHDGMRTYGDPSAWALYRVLLARSITLAAGASIRRACEAVAPVRCRLTGVDFTAMPYRYDAVCRYDGTVSHGVTL